MNKTTNFFLVWEVIKLDKQFPDWEFIQNLIANDAVIGAFSTEAIPDEVQDRLDSIRKEGLIACIQNDAVFFLGQEECRELGIPFKHQIYAEDEIQSS